MTEHEKTIQDIAEIRSMMERSSRFLSLSGWAGIMAGIYALSGAWMAHFIFGFQPDQVLYPFRELTGVLILAASVLLLSLVTALFFSWKKARSREEKIWNLTSKRLLISMAVPLVIGGVLTLIFVSKGLLGLIAPFTLIFYGMSLISAGYLTLKEVQWMGFVQVILGLVNTWHLQEGLLFWSIGFGAIHIIYGIYMYVKYDR